MSTWVNSHGIECIIIWAVINLISGALPPLPAGAGWWSTFAYGMVHALALNIRQVASAAGFKLPGDTSTPPTINKQ